MPEGGHFPAGIVPSMIVSGLSLLKLLETASSSSLSVFSVSPSGEMTYIDSNAGSFFSKLSTMTWDMRSRYWFKASVSFLVLSIKSPAYNKDYDIFK